MKSHLQKLFLFLISIIVFSACSSNEKPSPTNDEYSSIRKLVERGLNVNRVDSNGNTLLLYAASKGNIKLMKYLIKKGANINYRKANGVYPLYQFVTNGYKKNPQKKSLEFVKWMIEEKGADYKRTGYNKYTLIHASNDLELTKYLIELGLDINSLTKTNATTLMGSMAYILDQGEKENIPLQKYLIEHCIDLNVKAKFGDKELTTLDFAKHFERKKAMALLLEAMKNPPKQCRDGGVLAPKLSFYNLPETFDSENANISIQVEAQGFGVGDIVLLINGAEVSTDTRARALKVKRAGLKVRTFKVKLQNGLNELKAYAYDKDNKVKSKEIVHNVVASYKVDDKPKLYAVVVGVDEFKDSSLNLRYAEADATLFGSTLFKRSKAIFSRVNIDYMKKMRGTTKEVILNKLKSLRHISANDFFVFYSATHGIDINGKYYMLTSNVSSSSEDSIKKQAISEDELREAIKQIPTANKLLLFDTCYSGSINENISKKLAKSAIKRLNLTSITAANSAQTAIEGFADGHGIFTYVLSDALDGEADYNNDGLIQSMELVNYTNKMVPKEAKKFNHIQTPAYFQSGQVFNISKLRWHKGTVDMQPQYFQAPEVDKMVTYMNKKDAKSLNKLIETKKIETKKKVKKIVKSAVKVEAKKAVETIKIADKKFYFGRHNFVFNDNSIFLNIKDKIKRNFYFTDSKGRYLVVFDFYSKAINPRVVKTLDTQKVSNIYMADWGDWYRVTLQTKSKQSYEYVVNKDGIYIKLKNKQDNNSLKGK